MWDAVGGDVSQLTSVGEMSVLSLGLQKTLGTAFAEKSTEAGVGSTVGATIGTFAGGPFGMVVGMVVGGILGSAAGKLRGNSDVDYDFSMYGHSYEDNDYIETALGRIGLNSGSTRNVTMSQEGGAMLSGMEKVFGPMDGLFASALSTDELIQVREDLSNFYIPNSHHNTMEQNVNLMIKARLESMDKVMSPEKKQAMGFQQLKDQYNEQFKGPSEEEQNKIAATYQEYKSNEYKAQTNDSYMAWQAYNNSEEQWNKLIQQTPWLKDSWYFYQSYGGGPMGTMPRFDPKQEATQYIESMQRFKV